MKTEFKQDQINFPIAQNPVSTLGGVFFPYTTLTFLETEQI